MSAKQFKEANELGMMGEVLTAQHIARRTQAKVEKLDHRHNRSDLRVVLPDNKEYFVEVKTEVGYISRTGNIAVEVYENNSNYQAASKLSTVSDASVEEYVSNTMKLDNPSRYIVHVDLPALKYIKPDTYIEAYVFDYPTYRDFARSVRLSNLHGPWKNSNKGARGLLMQVGNSAQMSKLGLVETIRLNPVVSPAFQKWLVLT